MLDGRKMRDTGYISLRAVYAVLVPFIGSLCL